MDSRTKFSLEIERLKLNSPDVSYIDVIVEYIQDHDIDFHVVPNLLSVSLKQKIEMESAKRFLIDAKDEHFSMDELL